MNQGSVANSRTDCSQRQTIKFNTLKAELLPFIHTKQNQHQVHISNFTKNQLQNRWRSQAQIRQQYTMQKLRQKQGKTTEIQRLKNQLKNEGFFLKMQRKNLNRRLQTHLLIRTAMKEVANYQEYQLGKSKHLEAAL